MTDHSDPAASSDSADTAGSGSGDPISYETARAELAEVMRALESGGQSLEESLVLWRRGEELADVCQRWLDAASQRLDQAIEAAAHERSQPAD